MVCVHSFMSFKTGIWGKIQIYLFVERHVSSIVLLRLGSELLAMWAELEISRAKLTLWLWFQMAQLLTTVAGYSFKQLKLWLVPKLDWQSTLLSCNISARFARRTWLLERFVTVSDFSYLLLMLIIIQDLPTQACFLQKMRFDMVYWCVFTILHSLLLFILTFLGA